VFREAIEFLMSVALHALADHLAVENVQGRKQRRRAVALVVVGHRSATALLHRQAGLGAVEGFQNLIDPYLRRQLMTESSTDPISRRGKPKLNAIL